MGLVQKSFSDIITFSRSSNATRVGPTGLVEYAPHNLCLQSQTFDNASWTKSNVTVTANAIAAPDGTVTADQVTANTSSTFGYLYANPAVTNVQTFSIYAKQGSQRYFQILSTATAAFWANFDLQTGTASAGGSTTSATAISVGNGWYRCTLTVTDSSTSPFVFGFVSSLSAPRAEATTLTTNFYVWGAQSVFGPYALDYTPTTSAAVYGPRFDYDPVTLAARGLLVEESRSNLVTYSEDFSNAAWTKTNTTITSNSVTSPDGQVTADTYTATGSGEVGQLATNSQTTVTASVFVKRSNVDYCWLQLVNAIGSGNAVRQFFNIANGTVASAQTFGTGFAKVSASITNFSNDWYRVVLTCTVPAANCAIVFSVSSTDAPATTSNGNAAYFWGAQVE